MKNLFLFVLTMLVLTSCNQHKNEPITVPDARAHDTAIENYFPVTNFILGEIAEMKNNGINPLKITTASNKTDSVWLKQEELEKAFAEFLSPTIDHVNMSPFFAESKFFDRTINAYTFTYEPYGRLPDSLQVQRWDVYINPSTNTVNRIYIEKLNDQNKKFMLTWQSKEWSKVVILSPNAGIEKEMIIKWKFE